MVKPKRAQSMGSSIPLSIDELQVAASNKLPSEIREFSNSGSTSQVTVQENSSAMAKYRLRPRVLKNVANADTSTVVLSQKIAFPLCVAPAGLHAMAHPDGELATSRACAKRGINMAISTYANHSMEQITQAGHEVGPITHAMQLYTMKDRAMQERIVQRAEAAEDVLLAREYGCDEVIVSNHGGRQLDGTPATIDELPECVAAADGEIKVHIDGGLEVGRIFSRLLR